MVREHGEAIDAVELASRTGLHVTTVRFHLDALCDEGAIERTRIYRDGVGRPRTGYRAVEERLDYRILAEILAMELGETVQTRARRAQRAGQQWAGRIAVSHGGAVAAQDDTDTAAAGDPLDRGAALATEVFNRMGFDPELAAESEPMASLSADSKQIVGRERVIRLHACPVRDLARAHPRWVAPYTWDYCKACSTTPRPPVDNPTHESKDCRPGSTRRRTRTVHRRLNASRSTRE
jgi:predicted ArsR family transcriptional regulator